jgi:AcrR family transcriptional regulator
LNPTKRQRILNGMLEAVGADGYENTSVRSVLDRCGLYRQAFYDDFRDKEDCYLQAYDAGLGQLEAMIRASAAGAADWHGKVRAGLATLLDFLDAQPNVGRALIVEVHPAGEAALAKRDAAMWRAREVIDRGRAEARGVPEPPAIAAEAATSGIHAVLHSRLAAGGSRGFRELLPEFMYVLVLPYFGPEAAKAEMRSGPN